MSFITQYRQNPWNPTFKWVYNMTDAADKINQPHEDYPSRVDKTRNMIMKYKDYNQFQIADALYIHYHIMYNKKFKGKLRSTSVIVGNHLPPSYLVVPYLLRYIFPITSKVSIETAKKWFIDFQTLHPFDDGNGRVGGVILACLTHHKNKFLVPTV